MFIFKCNRKKFLKCLVDSVNVQPQYDLQNTGYSLSFKAYGPKFKTEDTKKFIEKLFLIGM